MSDAASVHSDGVPMTDSVEATPSNDHSRPGTYDGGYGVPEEPQAVANRQVEESGDDDVVPANAKPLKVNCPKLLIAGATDLLLELPPLNRHETATVQYRFALSTLGLLTSTVLPSFGRKWETATDPIEPASYYMRDAGPDTFVIRITNLTQLSAYNVRVVVANALGTTEGLESGEICTTDHVQDAVRQRSRQEGELTARRSMLPLMEALRSQVAATEADAASVRRELEETRSMLSNSTLDNRVLTSEVNSLKRQIEKLEKDLSANKRATQLVISTYKARMESAQPKAEAAASSEDASSERIAELENRVSELLSEVSAYTLRDGDRNKEVEMLLMNIESLTAESQNKSAALSALQEELDTVKQLLHQQNAVSAAEVAVNIPDDDSDGAKPSNLSPLDNDAVLVEPPPVAPVNEEDQLNLLRIQVDRLVAERLALTESYSVEMQKLSDQRLQEANDAEGKVERLRLELDQALRELADSHREYEALKTAFEQQSSALSTLRTFVPSTGPESVEAMNWRDQLTAATDRIKELEESVEQWKIRHQQVSAQVISAKRAAEEEMAKAKVAREESTKVLAASRARDSNMTLLMQQSTRLKIELAECKAELETMRSAGGAAGGAEWARERTGTLERLSHLQTDFDSLNAQYHAVVADLEAARKEYNEVMDAAVSAEAVAAQATNALETETARFGLERDRLQTELAAARSEALRLQGALASGGDSTTVADLNTQLTMKTGEVAMLTSQLRRMESDMKVVLAERDESRHNECRLQTALDDAAKRIGRVKDLETQWKNDMATFLATPFFASRASTKANPQAAVEEYLALRRMGFGHIVSANAVVNFPGNEAEQVAQCLHPSSDGR